jgi:hypothetical protein
MYNFNAIMYTSSFLAEVRRKALRRRVWYGTLDRVERGVLSLATQVVDSVESVVLGVELVKIVSKLNVPMRSGFVRHMISFGVRRAREIRDQAVGFNYSEAKGWLWDWGFVRYLAVLDYCQPAGWGSGSRG